MRDRGQGAGSRALHPSPILSPQGERGFWGIWSFAMTPRDRRLYPRNPIQRPVKLQCAQTGRYLAAQTRDVSAGGAMVHLDRRASFVPGQRVRVGIATDPNAAMISASDLVEAIVVRTAPAPGSPGIAVQFIRPVAVASAA